MSEFRAGLPDRGPGRRDRETVEPPEDAPLPRQVRRPLAEGAPPNLIGVRLCRPRPFSIAALVFAIFTFLFLVLAVVVGSRHLAMFAVLPAGIAVALWLARPARFEATFTDQGLTVIHPSKVLPYSGILDMFVPPHRDRYADDELQLITAEGYFTIPAGLNVRREDIHDFLLTQPLGQDDNRTVHPALRDFLRLQESLYGAEQVWVFRAGQRRSPTSTSRAAAAAFLAIAAAGAAWAGLGFLFWPREVWGGIGIGVALIAGLVSLLIWVAGRLWVKNWQKSSLVLSPGGFALVQGDLQGELRWAEVRKVQLLGRVLVLTIAGAKIVIADVFHRPLTHIRDLMERFWRG